MYLTELSSPTGSLALDPPQSLRGRPPLDDEHRGSSLRWVCTAADGHARTRLNLALDHPDEAEGGQVGAPVPDLQRPVAAEHGLQPAVPTECCGIERLLGFG